jgi:hypothetical protein
MTSIHLENDDQTSEGAVQGDSPHNDAPGFYTHDGSGDISACPVAHILN